MFWTKYKVSTRKTILSGAALCLAALGLIAGAQFNSTDASTSMSGAAAPAATFAGTNTGAIPDGLSGTPPQFGAPRVIDFAVSGVSGNVTNVTVNMTLTHTWVGDVDVVLRAPGGTPSHVIVSRIGVTTATSFGSSSDYSGLYNFSDAAAGTNIWTAAAANPVPPGTYRTTAPGQAGQTNPAPVTSLNTTFAGLTPAQANGTWTLTFRDAAAADLGTVTAANLTIEPTGPVPPSFDAPLDMDGNGRTDFVTVRNTGGGAGGQVTWFRLNNGAAGGQQQAWGIASDFFLSEDFDNDNKDDVAIWRPGAAGTAAFYIVNSSNNTVRIEVFGQTGDDPTVVDDYNNDGSADVAVYRGGVSAGQQSTWYYRTTAGGPVFFVPWGQFDDFPAPGDYDGDGSADFVVQRATAGGQGIFWRNLTTAADDTVIFGAADDIIVPGDYDGDGKTDVATARGIGGAINWFYEPSGTAGVTVVTQVLGSSLTDFVAMGDYDGDGKTDPAVWRPNADPTQCFFFWLNSATPGTFSQQEWGAQGDYPVANYNFH